METKEEVVLKMVRKVDFNNRFIIPKEICDKLGIFENGHDSSERKLVITLIKKEDKNQGYCAKIEKMK